MFGTPVPCHNHRMEGLARVPLVKIADAARAEVLAARLRAEGIDARVRSEAAGPYHFTVGQMAEAEILVPPDLLSDAREVLLASEVDETLGAAQAWRPTEPWPLPGRLVAVALLAAFLGLWLLRLARLFGS